MPEPTPTSASRPATGRAGPRALTPADSAYAEVGKLDPERGGKASYEIIPGTLTVLSPRVRRITAPNPGMMTGPGTNAYLIGAGKELAVIDPGPPDAGHVQAIAEAAQALGAKIRWILATHTHRDHSPGAAMLKEKTGAELIGLAAPGITNHDQTFHPDHVTKDGEVLNIAGCTIRVIHTPGHASTENCYLLEEEKLLFTGDHIMQGSTVVIGPPDGNMAVYMDSLKKLLAFDLDWLAPGHGFLIEQPHTAVNNLVAHRLRRENKVLEKLRKLGDASIEELVPLAYDEVPSVLHQAAARSLLAHLDKLLAEGRVSESAGRWRPN